MNKQPKLIDELITDMKSKAAKIARERDETTDADRFMYLDGKESVLRYYITELESGKFSDPIPLPTIKPKDWVRHRSIRTKGFVIETSDIGALIYWETGQRSWYPYDYLEVISHD
ncbi:hypothetical protein EHV15_05275 [Paenibacillus oralis]|uniref:Uncharacterized protein n=1 Tax=Paenibacillus oralis TaxID=2490856 RepID=A0A3P3TXJ7_9BACL|nr:hypothetical protein [Paenibacillus oralis]RRJ62426.1 hypothetical protein EHV15_05275 [Paenibacillus oralis]